MRREDAVGAFMAYIDAKDYAPKTITGYLSDLGRFQRFMEQRYNLAWNVQETSAEDIEAFLTVLRDRDGLKPQSRNRILACLHSFYAFLDKRGICANVAAEVDFLEYHRGPIKYLQFEDAERLIEGIDVYLVQVVAYTLLRTGMRISEATRLQSRDVNLGTRQIHVTGKRRKKRDIPINEKLFELLLSFTSGISEVHPDVTFFSLPRTGGLSASYFNKVLKDTVVRSGFPVAVTAHMFRHTFATTFIKRGGSLVDLQKLLGHASLTVTSLYLHSLEDDRRSSIELL